jgi:hypothetical protein
MELKHPSWYKALEKQRKEFEASERAQADKREREQGHKAASERASKPRVTSKKRRSTSD